MANRSYGVKVGHSLYSQVELDVYFSLVKLNGNIYFNNFALCKEFGEIDTCGQFHQHFMRAFCTNILAPKITKLKCN